MTAAQDHSEPDTAELVEGVLFYPIALVVSATVFPGMTLCIPGLIFAAVFLLAPLVAVLAVVALVVAVVKAPFLAVRAARSLAARVKRTDEVLEPVAIS